MALETIIGIVSLVGAVASFAAAGWARAGKLQVEILKTGQDELKTNQRDLAKSISSVHTRIDGVCRDVADVNSEVSELRGRIKPLEKMYDRVKVTQ